MKDYGKTTSTIKPQPIIVDDFSVWINSDIKEIKSEDFDGFEYNMVQYDKNEYILNMVEEECKLKKQLIDTQIALCEIYESKN